MSSSKNTPFKISGNSNLKVQNKILAGFLIVIVVFSLGMLISYNSSQQLARNNTDILDRYALLRAKSYELSLVFENQKATMHAYTIGLIAGQLDAFRANKDNIDNIMNELWNLTTVGEAQLSGYQLVDDIQALRPSWISSVTDKVMALPPQLQLASLRYNTVLAKQLVFDMFSDLVEYMASGVASHGAEYDETRNKLIGVIGSSSSDGDLGTTIDAIETVNESIYNDLNTEIGQLRTEFADWDLIMKIGRDSGNTTDVGQWITANPDTMDGIITVLDTFLIRIQELFTDTDTFLDQANNNFAPILAKLTELRTFSEKEMIRLKDESINNSNLVTTSTFAALIIGVFLSVFIGFITSRGISKPLRQLTTEEQAANVKELTVSAQELANMVITLENLVEKFKLQ